MKIHRHKALLFAGIATAVAALAIHAQQPAGIKDSGAGTVIDAKTGLMWQQQADKNYMIWPKAQQYCGALSLAGHSDWKLPTKSQLVSLWADGGFRSEDGDFYWTSEIDPDTRAFASPLAWIVSFKDGRISHSPSTAGNAEYLNAVRCVRPAQ